VEKFMKKMLLLTLFVFAILFLTTNSLAEIANLPKEIKLNSTEQKDLELKIINPTNLPKKYNYEFYLPSKYEAQKTEVYVSAGGEQTLNLKIYAPEKGTYNASIVEKSNTKEINVFSFKITVSEKISQTTETRKNSNFGAFSGFVGLLSLSRINSGIGLNLLLSIIAIILGWILFLQLRKKDLEIKNYVLGLY
jgi:hypothetical protein